MVFYFLFLPFFPFGYAYERFDDMVLLMFVFLRIFFLFSFCAFKLRPKTKFTFEHSQEKTMTLIERDVLIVLKIRVCHSFLRNLEVRR